MTRAADGSHAAYPGSYLAAAVLTGHLLDLDTAALAFDGALSSAVARYLREAADRIVGAERDDPRVTTEEHVRISCDGATGCGNAADAKAVTITLSAESCADLTAGAKSPAGRITTTASCRNQACTTVALAGWHSVPGGAITDGSYQVHVHIDLDANHEMDAGDLVACAEGFAVGGGDDLTVAEFAER